MKVTGDYKKVCDTKISLRINEKSYIYDLGNFRDKFEEVKVFRMRNTYKRIIKFFVITVNMDDEGWCKIFLIRLWNKTIEFRYSYRKTVQLYTVYLWEWFSGQYKKKLTNFSSPRKGLNRIISGMISTIFINSWFYFPHFSQLGIQLLILGVGYSIAKNTNLALAYRSGFFWDP